MEVVLVNTFGGQRFQLAHERELLVRGIKNFPELRSKRELRDSSAPTPASVAFAYGHGDKQNCRNCLVAIAHL